MLRRSMTAIVTWCFVELFSATQVMAQDSDSQTCETLCATPDAPWASIPWELDLVKAQKQSLEQAKPIFIWSMDGHPLACT
ncbi:MAG: hypothetical protein JNL67_22450 [Planctomycetaceae bacterium]|nr:hypothetical protein [Planctomycetaceae bacterium]